MRRLRWTPELGLITAAVILGCITVGALSVGAYHIPPTEVLSAFAARTGIVPYIGGINDTVIFDIRLTRIVLAISVGAALSCSGVVYQGVFRNPLVEPYILGVSSGAAFGAGLAVMCRFPFSIQLLAFVFGLVAVGMTYRLAIVQGQTPTITLVLSGVIIGSLFSALFAVFQYIGTTEQLRRLVFWILGGLHRATWNEVRFIAPVTFIGVAVIWRYAWWLNVLTLGDDEARALGVPVEQTRRILIIVATAITALVVSVSGIISWVGLMVPHAARMLVGPDHRYVIPLSALLGASFVIVSDTLARTVSTGEIPIAIITSILGAPVLLHLIRTRIGHFGGSS